jgi:hypothetical protein
VKGGLKCGERGSRGEEKRASGISYQRIASLLIRIMSWVGVFFFFLLFLICLCTHTHTWSGGHVFDGEGGTGGASLWLCSRFLGVGGEGSTYLESGGHGGRKGYGGKIAGRNGWE